jgi:hypothetical protein
MYGMKSDTSYYFPFKLTIKGSIKEKNQRMLTVKNLTFRISFNMLNKMGDNILQSEIYHKIIFTCNILMLISNVCKL